MDRRSLQQSQEAIISYHDVGTFYLEYVLLYEVDDIY